jgi:hypothetical protein
LILAVALTALFLLAAIESSLAILREHIVEADMLLKASLAGSATDAAVAAPAASMIPVVGQAVLGFILPWILAMIALPLETLVQSGRHVGGRVAAFGAGASATLLRILAHGCRKLGIALTALFDITIILPLQLERLIRRPRRDTEPVRRELPVRHEVTGEHGVAS